MKRRTGNLSQCGRGWLCKVVVNGKPITRMMRDTKGELITKRRDAEAAKANFIASLGLGVKDEVQILETLTARLNCVTANVRHIDSTLEAEQPAMTMLQAWCAFVAKPKGKTPRGRAIMPGKRTLADYEGRWNAFCTWMDKNYPKKDKDGNRIPWELRQIGKEHAERYIAKIGAGRSANTQNKTLTFLRLVFKVLAEDARIKANPFEGMNAAPLAVTRKRPLTMTELAEISKALEGQGEIETLFSLGYYTGARLGDCVSMRWDNLDMGARKIRYTPHKTAKGNQEITLVIAPALFTLLNAVPKYKRRGLVLPELGEMYKRDPAAVSKRVQQVFIDAGIETGLEVKGYGKKVARVGFHSLRHSHITALLEGGVPMDMVRQQAGHSTIGMTAHYYHASEDTLKAAAAALPEIGKANTPTKVARLAAVMNLLEGLDDSELAEVALAMQNIANRRKTI